jgi:hypothetical protein
MAPILKETLILKDLVFQDDAATELVLAMDLILGVYAFTVPVPCLNSPSIPGYGIQLTRLELLAILEARATKAVDDLLRREVQGIAELIIAFAETRKEFKDRNPL